MSASAQPPRLRPYQVELIDDLYRKVKKGYKKNRHHCRYWRRQNRDQRKNLPGCRIEGRKTSVPRASGRVGGPNLRQDAVLWAALRLYQGGMGRKPRRADSNRQRANNGSAQMVAQVACDNCFFMTRLTLRYLVASASLFCIQLIPMLFTWR